MPVGGPRMLRAMNDRAALYALLQSGPLSRIELEHEIGISKPAAAELLRRLERAELVRRAGYRDSGAPGPNAQLWEVNPAAGYAAGIDVSATGVDVAVADLTGAIQAETHVSTRGGGDPVRALRRAIAEVVRSRRLGQRDLGRVVVGISGSIDPVTGFLEYAGHMRPWHGFDLQSRLSAALSVPVTVENDVNLVALDESLNGCARGYHDVVLLWMGRGVAAAVILDGRLHRGARGGAGEIDFAPIGPGGRQPGDLLETPRVLELARHHGIRAGRGSTALRRAITSLSGELSAELAGDDRSAVGDAEAFVAELADRIAQSLVGSVALLDPELVVLAGEIGQAGGDRLASRVADRLHRMTAHRPEVRPVTGRLGSVRDGAVAAAIRELRDQIFGRPAEEDQRGLSLRRRAPARDRSILRLGPRTGARAEPTTQSGAPALSSQ